MHTAVVWFRRDFRLHDHTALAQALHWAKERQGKLLFFFHFDPYFSNERTYHHEYFFQTVEQFRQTLRQQYGIHVHILHGDVDDVFVRLIRCTRMNAIFFNKDEVGRGKERDDYVQALLQKHGVDVYAYDDAHMHEAFDVLKADGTPYKVYTPYYRAWRKRPKRFPLSIDMDLLCAHMLHITPLSEDDERAFTHWLSKCTKRWERTSEQDALIALQHFIETALPHYDKKRDIPSVAGTSRLSPHLKTGTISIRTVFHAVVQQFGNSYDEAVETYIKELAWRDFYHMIYAHFPFTKTEAFIEKYRHLPWSRDDERFQAWKEGKTGFPIVDAGMRQLKEEGWLHNRVRMIVASFLTKDYLIDWRMGEQYFQHMLIDYDEASNIGGWQWAASVGTDAVPYFRVFNPIEQSKKFDPDGMYIRTYVPELAFFPSPHIHEPWKSNFNINYPAPTVDHRLQRQRAIALFQMSELV
ncbi:deoxyribodipyrimidine photo-lyase [Anoxybacillus mongoliensis]|uniref:Deoxyribodipyrimidine photo-lyase n=2 Tax=Anoxybacillus mongoliensis TaxID=452565 RepID=A0A7W8JEJ6_9BACL|nr:deoxyribodipyrimidine photo-lyase [Anoxybacillus mongoliensis]